MRTDAAHLPAAVWYARAVKSAEVLVVEDEDDVRRLVRVLLERAGHTVVEAANGLEALRRLEAGAPDLVVLDVAMPELDGWQTLERIRDLSEVPVLMLTARAGELDKVRGLRSGADDYVTKPFGRQELLARVEALLRRTSGPPAVRPAYEDAMLRIDYVSREVTVAAPDGGRRVQLTPLEFKLLSAFVRHPNETLSRARLLELVWGDVDGFGGDQVKLYVGYLRRKLGWGPTDGGPLETVRGFGYRYRPPAAAP
ncbi:MAG: response regulator transcription factor [Actinobacteria bacterium]|nr:response regulator transcription factor [Actinomycetota bacterium]